MVYHIPILGKEIVDELKIKENGTYIDCTIGFGGHSELIAKKLNSKGKIIGMDLDPYALKMAKEKLEGKYSNVMFYNNSYLNFPDVLNSNNIKVVDGFLFDLGISSYQVDSEHRGFSYRYDGPLQMKFNPNDNQFTAKDLLNKFSEKQISILIKEYGEERFHKRIAKAIVEKRKKKKIETTLDLKNIIFSAVPYKNTKILSRVFQAIRIATNDEINVFKTALSQSLEYLKIGGRIAVISFHSIEDRIVKHFFKKNAANDMNDTIKLKIITKKPIIPKIEEIRSNRRAKSAKLRIAERIV